MEALEYLPDLPKPDQPVREHMYLLPEEDLTTLLDIAAVSGSTDAALLRVWEEAHHYDLDTASEGDPTLAEMISAAPDLPPEAFHAIVFTYTDDAEAT
jgi:hypothetical protein